MRRDRSVPGIRAHEGVTTKWAVRIIKAAAGIPGRAMAKIYNAATVWAAALDMTEIGERLRLISPRCLPCHVVVGRNRGPARNNYHPCGKHDF